MNCIQIKYDKDNRLKKYMDELRKLEAQTKNVHADDNKDDAINKQKEDLKNKIKRCLMAPDVQL